MKPRGKKGRDGTAVNNAVPNDSALLAPALAVVSDRRTRGRP
jgi:hypothetical protein